MKKVTVIIPVYNVEKYLRRCLDSILRQNYSDYEIICVNDCSPDHSGEILKEYKENYSEKIQVIENEENIGLGRSRMRGVNQASGEYLLFIDSDDYVAEDYIERYMREVKDTSYDIVIAGYTKDIDGKYIKHDIQDSLWTLVCYPIACAKLYRKSFILENGIEFSPVRCGEDIYFSLVVFIKNVKYKIIHYCGYYYYHNRKSITGSLTYDKKHEVFVSQIFDDFLNKNPLDHLSEEKKRMIEYTYVANMVNALVTYGHGCRPRMMKEKYQFFLRDMKEKFPDYRSNPYFGIMKPKGQSSKIRIGVGVTMLLHKVHLDAMMFWLLSWV